MPDLPPSESDSVKDINDFQNFNTHEGVDDSSDFFNEEEFEEVDDMAEFDDDDVNIQSSPPSSNATYLKIAGAMSNLAEMDLTKKEAARVLSKEFQSLPEEIQEKIWRFVALLDKHSLIIILSQETFKFANCPATPAFMHVCHRARKYGQEIFKACDEHGRPHDVENTATFDKFYFYVNPFGDDFILRFGEEKDCPEPTYRPRSEGTSYMRIEMETAERKLEEEYEELSRRRREEQRARTRPNLFQWAANHPAFLPAHAPFQVVNVAGAAPNANAQLAAAANNWPWNANGGNFLNGTVLAAQAAAAQAGQATPVPPPPPPAGDPVFPPDNKLPEFFSNIRSVGINLELPFSHDFDFSKMNATSLRNWAKEAINRKFKIVFTQGLDRFPNLEYAFVVIRPHGRSNQDCGNRFEREPEKKQWTSIGMAKGEGTIMGYDEFLQVELHAKMWFRDQRCLRGLSFNGVDFGLYVQTNIQWEI